ncbi:hypothetical protein SAMN05444747_10165 [Variovorax sp. OV329]|nr:hypothetical protein SAMN05444747_10165 [Variovorax sp. OV329]
MRTRWMALALALPAQVAMAVHLQCVQTPRASIPQCLSPDEVRELDGIRGAPLYLGIGKDAARSHLSIHANCATGFTQVKDEEGVVIAGIESQTVRELRSLVCGAPVKGSPPGAQKEKAPAGAS